MRRRSGRAHGGREVEGLVDGGPLNPQALLLRGGEGRHFPQWLQRRHLAPPKTADGRDEHEYIERSPHRGGELEHLTEVEHAMLRRGLRASPPDSRGVGSDDRAVDGDHENRPEEAIGLPPAWW